MPSARGRRCRPRGQDARCRLRRPRRSSLGIAAWNCCDRRRRRSDRIGHGTQPDCRRCHTEPRFGMVRAARHDAPLAERGALRSDRMPLAQSLSEVPILGRVYTTVISGYSLPVYLAWLAVPLTAFVLARTRFGLRLWAVGESPEAVAAAGLSVARLRLEALAVNGALRGVAGVFLSMAQGNGFLRDMSAGRGYPALAALIFGKWRPWPVLGACLLFAAADAVQVRLQGAILPAIGTVPVQLIQALPYLITVAILAGFVGTARPPRALGKPYLPAG